MQVKITIQGRQYTVRGEDPGKVEALARLVDSRMNEVASGMRSIDEYTVALLTALNIASELEQVRADMSDKLLEFDREAASVQAILESMLPAQEQSDS